MDIIDDYKQLRMIEALKEYNNMKVCYKQLKRKENELEDLRQYHDKCCEEFKKEKQDLIDKYNQLSINFYNGDYCNTEHCNLLKAKEQECKELNSDNRYFVNQIISLETLTDKYEQAFNDIEKNIKGYCKNMCMAETKETCDCCQNTEVLDIINKVKEQ